MSGSASAITPAMAAGVTDHAWGVADIVAIGGPCKARPVQKASGIVTSGTRIWSGM